MEINPYFTCVCISNTSTSNLGVKFQCEIFYLFWRCALRFVLVSIYKLRHYNEAGHDQIWILLAIFPRVHHFTKRECKFFRPKRKISLVLGAA